MVKYSRWKQSEDLILVECITKAVSQGKNYMDAFPIASIQLGSHRTEKACYSRWISQLSPIYGPSVVLAQRKASEYAEQYVQGILAPSISFKDVQDYMASMHVQVENLTIQNNQHQKELDSMHDSFDIVSQENETLKKKIVELESNPLSNDPRYSIFLDFVSKCVDEVEVEASHVM